MLGGGQPPAIRIGLNGYKTPRRSWTTAANVVGPRKSTQHAQKESFSLVSVLFAGPVFFYCFRWLEMFGVSAVAASPTLLPELPQRSFSSRDCSTALDCRPNDTMHIQDRLRTIEYQLRLYIFHPLYHRLWEILVHLVYPYNKGHSIRLEGGSAL